MDKLVELQNRLKYCKEAVYKIENNFKSLVSASSFLNILLLTLITILSFLVDITGFAFCGLMGIIIVIVFLCSFVRSSEKNRNSVFKGTIFISIFTIFIAIIAVPISTFYISGTFIVIVCISLFIHIIYHIFCYAQLYNYRNDSPTIKNLANLKKEINDLIDKIEKEKFNRLSSEEQKKVLEEKEKEKRRKQDALNRLLISSQLAAINLPSTCPSCGKKLISTNMSVGAVKSDWSVTNDSYSTERRIQGVESFLGTGSIKTYDATVHTQTVKCPHCGYTITTRQ